MEDPYQAPESPQPGGGGSKVFVIVIVLVAVVCLVGIAVVGVVGAVLMPSIMKAKEKANMSKCSSTLRQVALGAIQYADDKRFFPHVEAPGQLDGDPSTNHGPKALRALINGGYLSSDMLICPSSLDLEMPRPPGESSREWFWDGDTRPDPRADPIGDGLDDPTLLETSELSYGWTRRGLNSNARSSMSLAADRSVRTQDSIDALDPGEAGNHEAGLNVAKADGAVFFEALTQDPFTELLLPENGALGIIPPR